MNYLASLTRASADDSLRNRLETERDSLDRMLSVQYRSRAMVLLRQARKDPRELVSDAFLAAAICIGHNDVSYTLRREAEIEKLTAGAFR